MTEQDIILAGIYHSEERLASGGSVVFPNSEKNYDLIPERLKIQYDLIRIRYGITPRWLEK